MMKGFLIGAGIVLIAFVLSFRSGAASRLARFAPGGMVNQGQGAINRQNSSGATASTSTTSGAGKSNCYPTSESPTYKCIPRGKDGSVLQLGGGLPEEFGSLPNTFHGQNRK